MAESWDTGIPVQTAAEWDTGVPVQPKSKANSKAPPWANVVANAGPEAIAGLGDTVINFGPNAVRLGQMGYGAAASALGHPDAAPSITPPRNYMREGLTNAGVIADLSGTEMTPNQRVTNSMLQAGTLGLLNPAQSLGQAATSGAKVGFTGAVGQTATELTGRPEVGMAVNMLAPNAGSRVAGLAQRHAAAAANRKADNEVAERTLRDAQALGYKTTPGSMNPSVKNVMLERVAGKSVAEGDMSISNQRVTDNLARKALDVPENTPLTKELTKQIRSDEYNLGYKPVEQIGQIATDSTFSQAIRGIKSKFTGASNSFPGAEPDAVGKLVKTYDVATFDSADAIKASALLREEAATNFIKGETRLAKAQAAASKALEDQIERHLQNSGTANQGILDQFKASRRRMAISHTVEDALRIGSGRVEAKVLARNLQGGKVLAPELETAAKFANTFPFVNRPTSAMGTPGTNTMGLGASTRMIPLNIGGAIGGMIGANYGGMPGAGVGGLIGGAMPTVASLGASRYLRSGGAQRNAFANYDTPIANLLAKESLTPDERNLLRTLIAQQQLPE